MYCRLWGLWGYVEELNCGKERLSGKFCEREGGRQTLGRSFEIRKW
jgi:hypothetical protein